jgi:acylglycerol lipase
MLFFSARKYLLLTAVLLGACASVPPPSTTALKHSPEYSEEFFYNQQGLKLFARTWNPRGEARGNVVILHGTAMHSGVYAPAAEALTAAGYRVFAYDLQGWGRSEGKGADGYVDSFDDYAKDLYRVLNKMKTRYPNVPNFVMGESLGGTIALYGVLKKDLAFDGIITSAAGYKPNPELMGIRAPGFINDANMTLAKWWGQGVPNAPMLEADTGIRMVIEDDALQAQLLADPYVSHGWLPAAYGSTLVEANAYIDEHLDQLKQPLLLMHGTQDMLVPKTSSEEIYERSNSGLKRLEIYNAPHALLLEQSQTRVMQDVVKFLEEATSKGLVASHTRD